MVIGRENCRAKIVQRAGQCAAALTAMVLAGYAEAMAQAPAATASAVAPAAAPDTFGIVTRMGLMFIVAYFIFSQFAIKPQKARLQQQQQLVDTLKRGEQVVTTSGMIGKVANVDKEYALLELAPNVKVKFEISHIAKRLDKPEVVNS